MLSSMSALGYDATDLTKDDLSDEVIGTLYDIVRRAQSSSDNSSRALFAAYGAVLEEQGRQPSDDAVLHRFLFLMQKHRQDDEDLVQRFGRVLKESFDFDVEINEDGEGLEVTASFDATRNGAHASLGRYSRRGSFDSFFDGTADKVAGTEHGDLSVRTRRGSQGAPNGYTDKFNPRRVRSDTQIHAHGQGQYAVRKEQLPIRYRTTGRSQRRSVSGPHQSHPKRSTSVSSRASLRIRRKGYKPPSQTDDIDGDSDFTDRTTSLDLSHIQIPGVNAPIPEHRQDIRDHRQYMPEPYRPSDTGLLNEAGTFEEQRLHRVTRHCIQAWRYRMQERMSIHDDMDNLALAFRRKILLKASFPLLHTTARARRSNRETDRFFTRLETRADRARALFLLTKAFTHWAKSAEDEVQRTSVARRHILRTRFFNGWRDITAVNELKIQHFVLGNFLQRWRVKAVETRKNRELAVTVYEKNLVRRVYHEWMFKFFDSAAPAWHNDKIRKVTLHKLVEIAKVLKQRDIWATARYERSLLQWGLKKWQQKTSVTKAQQLQSEKHQRTTQLSSVFRKLQKRAQLVPLLQHFQARIDNRRVRSAFQQWQKVTQLSQQARNVGKLRILRNAYTAWNDRLRSKVVEDRIDDRVIVKALYKWALASRVSLFQRVHDRQLKDSMFLIWVTRTNERTNTLETAERRFALFKRTQILRTALRKMEVITSEMRREEFAVVVEYQQKLKQRIFNKLKDRNEHFQELNQWTKDARFYVLSKRTLKTWGEATHHARRNRRRETYAQIRRTMKTNLVKRVIAVWRDKANHLTTLDQQASGILQHRVLQAAGVRLHQWYDCSTTLRQFDNQAASMYSSKLSLHYFNTWSSRLDTFHTLDNQANVLRQESAEIAAASALKKLGWRLWNLQRKEENANALYERNFEKHVRAMMRYWHEQMAERRAVRGGAGSPTPNDGSRSRSTRANADNEVEDGIDYGNEDDNDEYDGPNDESQHLEAWTAFDETALEVNNDLDLSLNITPQQQHRSSVRPSSQRLTSILRPNTTLQPHSILRPPQLQPTAFSTADTDLEAEETFWSGTPLPPPPTAMTTTAHNPFASSMLKTKPGYLKTPSKRTLVRAKRPDLGVSASPEKVRFRSPVRNVMGGLSTQRMDFEGQSRLGTMSAPPGQIGRHIGTSAGGRVGGVTSFQRRLRDGGFGATVGVGGSALKGSRGRERGKARVGFGDLGEIRRS